MNQVRDVFDDWASHGRADDMERSHWPFVRRALERLPIAPASWYLDIGCGNGYAVRWVATRVPRGKAVGLDLSPKMIELARERAAGLTNVEFQVAAFPRNDLPAGRFDAIFSMEVFYYLPDLGASLRAARRLLAPGGVFCCMVDYYEENTASHAWPHDVGLPMTMLDATGWRSALLQAGFGNVEQHQITLPPDEASESWKSALGSLLTMGRRAPEAG